MTGTRPALIVLGAAAGVAQAILLRETLAAFGGSELVWGLVMATWLTAVALGARLGRPVAGHWTGQAALPAIPLATALGVVLMRALPTLQHAAAGEQTNLVGGIAWWLIAIVPPAALVGLAFPTLVPGGPTGPALGYAIEALGAAAGGIAVAALLGPGSTTTAVLLAIAGAVGFALWNVRRWLAVVAAALIVIPALPAAEQLAVLTWRWSHRPGSLAGWAETRHQRLAWSQEIPRSIYGDSRLLATWPEPYTVVPAVHLRLLLHPEPHRVLVIGGLLDGTLEVALRHPIDDLHVVADDPQLARAVVPRIDSALARPLASPRVHIHRDPIETVAKLHDLDLILLGDPGPPALRTYRTRTVEMLRACRGALNEDGILVMDLPVSDTYLGGATGTLLASLVATVGCVFPHLDSIPGEHLALIAGGPAAEIVTDPTVLAARWRARAVDDPRFDPAMLPMLLDRVRADELRHAVRAIAPVPPSTRERSPALLAATALDLGRRGHRTASEIMLSLALLPRWPVLGLAGAVVIAMLIPLFVGRPPRSAPAFALGFVSMGAWVLLMSIWQATIGSAYSQIGALTGCLMAGIGLGAWWASRSALVAGSTWWSLVAGGSLTLAIASGLPYLWPRLTIPLLLAAVGLVTGAGFPGAAAITAPDDHRRAAARGFAADDVGAAAAAGLVGALLLPWAGLTLTALVLAATALAAAPAARLLRRP